MSAYAQHAETRAQRTGHKAAPPLRTPPSRLPRAAAEDEYAYDDDDDRLSALEAPPVDDEDGDGAFDRYAHVGSWSDDGDRRARGAGLGDDDDDLSSLSSADDEEEEEEEEESLFERFVWWFSR
jgi:hypothetical protein